jgi:hypothetical protein
VSREYSKKRSATDAVPQEAHLDWQLTQLMESRSNPVGMLVSVMDLRRFHLWPDSLDDKAVRRADMITIDGILYFSMVQQYMQGLAMLAIMARCTLRITSLHAALRYGTRTIYINYTLVKYHSQTNR